MASEQRMTFTAASGAAYTGTDWKLLQAPEQFLHGGAQFGRLLASSATTSGTAMFTFALRDGSEVHGTQTVTTTPGTLRTGLDGASGRYVNAVAFSETGTSKFDLLGQGKNLDKARWYVGCTSFPAGETSIVLDFYWAGQSQ